MKIIQKIKNMTYEDRAWKIAIITSLINFALAVGKFIFGIALSSYYFCVIAMYGAIVGLIKQRCYGGVKKNLPPRQTAKRYTEGGVLMAAAGIFYTVYAARLLFYPEHPEYSLIASIAVAAFGFAGLGMSIRGMIKARGKGLMLREIKILSFSSALTDIVLVQIALLAANGSTGSSRYNAWIGMAVGAVIIALAGAIIITGIIEHKKAAAETLA